jgi:hypothetical protein
MRYPLTAPLDIILFIAPEREEQRTVPSTVCRFAAALQHLEISCRSGKKNGLHRGEREPVLKSGVSATTCQQNADADSRSGVPTSGPRTHKS